MQASLASLTGESAARAPREDVSAIARRLDAELTDALSSDRTLPGIIAHVDAPPLGLTWSGACGVVGGGDTTPLTPDHAFRVASVTKPFTAAVALRLFEQDRLPLFTPISGLLAPRVRGLLAQGGYAPETITIYHLLTHSSGLRDHAGRATAYVEYLTRDPGHVWTHEEQIDACMAMGPPLSPPGRKFSYSDTGYLILGDILERVAGAPLHLLMRNLLDFEGLGLRATHFERHEPPPPGQRRAGQYVGTLPGAGIDCSCDLSGGGGLVSTARELARYYRAAARGELFERPGTLSIALATPSLIHSPPVEALHSPLMRGRMIGLEPSWMHGGAWGLMAAYFPASDISLALSFNQLLAGPTTTGAPGDPSRPSLADRLAIIVQRAAHAATGNPRP
jgi:D-alanyl-D-alanine carboxypeptidase